MKDIHELPDLMVELIETVEENSESSDRPTFTPRAVEIIKEISEYAQGTAIYKNFEAKANSFWPEGAPASEIWVFMLRKIVGAPLPVYRDTAVLCHMPALEKAIKRETPEGGAAE